MKVVFARAKTKIHSARLNLNKWSNKKNGPEWERIALGIFLEHFQAHNKCLRHRLYFFHMPRHSLTIV